MKSFIVSYQQGHMKTHPGAPTSTPLKAQANENDENHSSHATRTNSGQQEEKQGANPDKGDGTDLPIRVDSDVKPETTDTTA